MFRTQKDYASRIAFVDAHFPVMTDLFSNFDLQLEFLFIADKTQQLVSIYKQERIILARFRKQFSFGDRTYIFDARPAYSNRAHFNAFILDKLVNKDKQYNRLVSELETSGVVQGRTAEELLAEMDTLLMNIRDYLLQKRSPSFRIQFMKLFYNGYNDCLYGNLAIFKTRKKFVELFIYAQGLLFCRFRQLARYKMSFDALPETKRMESFTADQEWQNQIILLQRTGMLDVLNNNVSHPMESVKKDKISTIICRIIGQHPVMKDRIAHYLNFISAGNNYFKKPSH